MRPKMNVMRLPLYEPGKSIEEVKRELGLTEVIKLASNENPFGCSPRVTEAIRVELENIYRYPDSNAVDLRLRLAEIVGIQPNQIIFGAGSDEVILMLARAYLAEGDESIMSTHSFPLYKHNSELENAVCIEIPHMDGKHDLHGMLSNINERTKMIWICNPNNPTGTMISHSELKYFLRNTPPHVLVVVDEAYSEYVLSKDYANGIRLLKDYSNLVLLRTFSKIYGLASMRIGYGIGHSDVIRTVNKVREPFNTNRFAQVAALASLEDQAFVESCRWHNREGIIQLCSEFDKMGLNYLEPHGNFILVDVQQPAEMVFDELLKKGIIIRGGDAFEFPTHIRVTVGNTEQNNKFVRSLREVIATLAQS
ncbi:MAG TPA: histidinol-phosphate transaminase [Candidatus Paenibacillus intestinavium]|nr:histidinol-phosphate transaminase [Candidatus Paenibacillus intestinavium]